MPNYEHVPSPCYVVEEELLMNNLALLAHVQKAAGVQIILAFKGFAMWSTFGLVRAHLAGATASSLNEARLCFEEMQRKAHTYMVAYIPSQFEEILGYSSHLTFNSLAQFERYRAEVAAHSPAVSVGLRVNPEYSEVTTDLYNPCAPGSRLGELAENLPASLPIADEGKAGIEGLHFHALCESSAETFAHTLAAFEARFGKYLPALKWVNFGGGHLITRKDYDVDGLIRTLLAFRARYPHLEVILEPGSAVAWQTGVLRATVLDIVENKGIRTLLTDMSFTCHAPDTLEMPYRPAIVGAHTEKKAGLAAYRIGGQSCLAGDYLEAYWFDNPVAIGDTLVFEDMIHYTMVKTNTFNGVGHPSIGIQRRDGTFDLIRTFGYEDYKQRLS